MTDLITLAKDFAMERHSGQVRKGKTTPFFAHLESAASIASNLTSDQDILAATWLHDVVEDTDTTLQEVEALFGPTVAHFVDLESEDKMNYMGATDSWKVRKEMQLETLSNLSNEDKLVFTVTLSDKLANLRELYEDYLALGDDVFLKFNNGVKEDHYWYYSSFLKVIQEYPPLRDKPELGEMASLINSIWL